MGWFWQSSTPSSPNSGSTAPSSPPPPSSQQTPAASPPPPPPPAQTPDQIEVQKFLQSFMEQAEPKAAATPPPPPPQPTTTATPPPAQQKTSSFTSWLPWSKSAAPETTASQADSIAPLPLPPKGRSPQSRQMSEHNLPTTMSCRDAFDYAWHCHTAGSQWNAVYRYGEMRSCSELWDDFWFCMRARNYSEEGRQEAIKEHYRAKEERKYGGGKPSSEDIWESREERLPVGGAFKKPFPPPVEDDVAYRRSEIERRKRIRKELGLEAGDGEDKKE